MLGDVINRGPDSAGVLRYIYEQKFEIVLGNHEYNYLMVWNHSAHYRILHDEIGSDMHRWILKWPAYIEDKDFIAVHAGLAPGIPAALSPVEILTNIRTWDGEGKDLRNMENPPWYDFYTGEKTVFYGHWAKQGLTVRKNTVGLDSGCVYGNALSAYVLEEKKLYQVNAVSVYEKIGH